MSLGKQDVVPVDTHIHSIALTYYGQKKSQLTGKNYDQISMFFEQLWKPYAGWAQAVSFSFYRTVVLHDELGGIFQ